jgi:hypothetical protein
MIRLIAATVLLLEVGTLSYLALVQPEVLHAAFARGHDLGVKYVQPVFERVLPDPRRYRF